MGGPDCHDRGHRLLPLVRKSLPASDELPAVRAVLPNAGGDQLCTRSGASGQLPAVRAVLPDAGRLLARGSGSGLATQSADRLLPVSGSFERLEAMVQIVPVA